VAIPLATGEWLGRHSGSSRRRAELGRRSRLRDRGAGTANGVVGVCLLAGTKGDRHGCPYRNHPDAECSEYLFRHGNYLPLVLPLKSVLGMDASVSLLLQ
jgi:hypothetical protein